LCMAGGRHAASLLRLKSQQTTPPPPYRDPSRSHSMARESIPRRKKEDKIDSKPLN
jgi:hypothetical protein